MESDRGAVIAASLTSYVHADGTRSASCMFCYLSAASGASETLLMALR